MPKILDEKARGLSDSEQMVMALFSEGKAGEIPSNNRNNRKELGNDQFDGLIDEHKSSGLLDKMRSPRRFW